MPNNPFMPTPSNMPNTPMPGMPTNSAADNYEVDLSNIADNGFVIPDGNYRMKCVDIEQNVSKGGNPMFVWTFEVVEGEKKGFQSKLFTALTPAAMWKVAEVVEALGIGQTGTVVKFKRSDVLNKECGALIEKTEYQGQERSQISRIMSLKELLESRA